MSSTGNTTATDAGRSLKKRPETIASAPLTVGTKPKNHVDNTETYHQPTHISLCTGYGGIDLGLARVVSNLRTIAYCEREAAAIELLLSRMENGQLDAAPIWTDLQSFPWEAFSDRVDILSGGYPCQPFSAAGKRLGTNDERHLWPFIADGVRILRPRICFFENVEGHITLGLSTVISDLEGMGYKVSFGIFSAAEVGAPHQRKRVFVMAYRNDSGLEGTEWLGKAGAQGESNGHFAECHDDLWPSRPGEPDLADSNGTESGEDWKSSELAYSTSDRLNGGLLDGETDKQTQGHAASRSSAWPSRPGEPQYWWEPPRVVANTECIGRRGRSYGDAKELCGEIQTARLCDSSAEPAVGDAYYGRQSSGINAGSSGSTDCGREAHIESPCSSAEPAMGDAQNERRRRLDDESSETSRWQARGHVDGTNTSEQQEQRKTEPEVGGGIDGAPDWVGYGELCVSCDNRTDELRMLGNGVVPATAARAFVTLIEELL